MPSITVEIPGDAFSALNRSPRELGREMREELVAASGPDLRVGRRSAERGELAEE